MARVSVILRDWAVDDDGHIYVADWGNERVRVLTPKGEVLATLRGESRTPSWANEYFEANPEEGALRLEAEFIAGQSIRRNAGTARNPPTSRNCSGGPTAVKLDGHGHILVVDSCRHRIQVYRWDSP